MRRRLIATASALALLACAGAASAERPGGEAGHFPPASANDYPVAANLGAGAKTILTDPGVKPTFEDDSNFGASGRDEAPAEYRSYEDPSRSFQGRIAGGYAPDELIDAEILGPDGQPVGEISDLLIGAENRVDSVLVSLLGLPGQQTRQVVLEIGQLELEQGAGGQFTTALSQKDLEAMPSFAHTQDGSWREQTAR